MDRGLTQYGEECQPIRDQWTEKKRWERPEVNRFRCTSGSVRPLPSQCGPKSDIQMSHLVQVDTLEGGKDVFPSGVGW